MEKNEILKKVRVTKQEAPSTFYVEDLFDSEELIMKIPGKLRMNYIRILIGDILYLVLPSSSSKEGKVISEKYIRSEELLRQRTAIYYREEKINED